MGDRRRSRSPDRRERRRDYGPPGDGYYDRSRHARHDSQGRRFPGRGRDEGRGGYAHDHRSSRRDDWEEYSYDGMYDDDHYRRDDRRDHGRMDGRRYGEREDYHHQGYDAAEGQYRRHRTRSRSAGSNGGPGEPSDTIVLEYVPFGIQPHEVIRALKQQSRIGAEFPPKEVRIDESSGDRRAYVEFRIERDAEMFIREHFPEIHLTLREPTDGEPAIEWAAYMQYARHSDPGAKWQCPKCDFLNWSKRKQCKHCLSHPAGKSPFISRSNRTVQPGNLLAAAPSWKESLTGERDKGDAVTSEILVVFPVPSHFNEGMLANEMKRLEKTKPNPNREIESGGPKLRSTAPVAGLSTLHGGRPDSLRRVFLMRDADTNESLKFGFLEFWAVQDANGALMRFQNSGAFTVDTVNVTIAPIHMGVFVPEDRPITDDIEKMSFNPLFNPTLRVRYRDSRAYPCEKVVNPEDPNPKEEPKASEADILDPKKAKKKRKGEADLGGPKPKKTVPMAGQMAMWQRKAAELRDDNVQKQSQTTLSDANKIPVGSSATGTSRPITIAPFKMSLPASSKSGSFQKQPDRAVRSASHEKNDQASSPEKHEAEGQEPTAVSYMDRDKLQCLICMRKYKSLDECDIHEKSRNHKTTMEDKAKVEAALGRLVARGLITQEQADETAPSDAAAEPQYRDRAKERREAFNQPKKPAGQSHSTNKADGSKQAAPTSALPPAPPKPQPSKGAGMLAKMGWTTGEGLGATGEGRTETIVTNAYQERVGLGAEGGNLGEATQLAEQKTKNDRGSYAATVQDKARERYNKMT